MSAFGGKADIIQGMTKSPLIARSGHSDDPWCPCGCVGRSMFADLPDYCFFLAAHGLHGLQAFFLAAHGLHGLQAFFLAAHGLQGLQGPQPFFLAAHGLQAS